MGRERANAARCEFRHYFDLVERRLALAAPLVATWLSRAALLTGPAVGTPRRRLSSPVLFKFLTIATNALAIGMMVSPPDHHLPSSFFFFEWSGYNPDLPSFPTRSSASSPGS